jgi:hypothetical protein
MGSGASWPTLYAANKKVIDATARAHGFTGNFAHWIFPGEHLTIPGKAGSKSTTTEVPPRYFQVHTPGHWETEVVPGPIGSPDSVTKAWVLDEETPIAGFVKAEDVDLQAPDVVIYGEEGRVSDWDPKRDGYGRFLEEQTYKTPAGHVFVDGPGWYPQDWDISDNEWTIGQQPWPEGEAYLTDYLKRRNAEITVQTFHVVNRNNLWADICVGGVYTFHATLEGPVPGGIMVDVRVLAFSPNEMTGECEIVAEVYIP